MSLGKRSLLGEDSRDRRRSVGQLQHKALAGNRREPFRRESGDRMRYKNDRNDNGDLHGLVSREAQRTIVVDLAVGVSVRHLQDAGGQHERHTDNSQYGNQGTPRPAC